MAIWQYRLILLPEEALLKKYEILPRRLPMELAEDFAWRSDVQPSTGFEDQIDLILPRTESWSASMRMWGQNDGDDAHVCYADESKTSVEEIAFRIDARTLSSDLVHRICVLASSLGCVLMTADYQILPPYDEIVLNAASVSTSKRFVDDPGSTLLSLDQPRLQERIDYFTKDQLGKPPNE